MTLGARAAVVAALVAGSVVPVPLLGAGPCAAHAQPAGTARAGVVVQFGDLSVREFCVSFTEPSITGFELLRRTGLPVVYQDYGGGSVAVCMIGGEGCDHPREPCFCRCLAAACTFWGYYTIDASGLWRFSQAGAGARTVRDGDVDGWRWGQHAQGLGAPPPSTLEGICERGERIGPSTPHEAGAPAPPSGSGAGAGPTPASTRDPASRAEGATPAPRASVRGATHTLPGAEPEQTQPSDASAAAPVGRGPGAREGPGAGTWAGFGAVVAALGAWGTRLARARRGSAT